MFAVLLLSLFLTEPAPLDMPRADAYLVREKGRTLLEDRFNRLDLWVSQTVTGRWVDEEDRQFVLASLSTRPPAVGRDETVTRQTAASEAVSMARIRANHDIPRPFREAVALLSPCPILEKPRSPRQLPRGYKTVYYWQHPTNRTAIVCTFLPERADVWQLATWQLAEKDDYAAQMDAFENQFLRGEYPRFIAAHPPAPTDASDRSERQLLRDDACHSVAAYDNWHTVASKEFVVLDNLENRDFITVLTNDFPIMRARYAATLPTLLDDTNVTCVARLYSNRDEYLDALEVEGITNLTWSAAYWSQERRELVAYLPWNGEKELLQTVRHEAFHQYLSYATSMIPASPWLNEGYAQYFEQGETEPTLELPEPEKIAGLIAPLLSMNYAEFYSGSDFERRCKYRLALSIAIFLEKGASKIRFDPFKNLKHDYMAALLETHDMRKATAAAFGNKERLQLFVSEWQKFWENR